MAFVRLLRPQQWIKNTFVFAGPIFGKKLLDPEAMRDTLLGFVCLCLVSSAVYVFNDIRDREEDKLHPRKCRRPIAAGEIAVGPATLVALALLLIGVAGAWMLDGRFLIVVIGYVALQALYNAWFKHAVILDVITIGLGFVLRAVAGVFLAHVPLSPWLVLCTFTLCLFMGFSKRRCELNALAANGGPAEAGRHRRTLTIYTPDLLNHMTTLTAGIAIVTFMLYTVDPRTGEKFGGEYMLYTLPIVVYAVFRFAVLVEHGEVDGPTDVVLKDRPFQLAILLWAAAAVGIVYFGDELRRLLGSMAGAAPAAGS